MELKFKKIKAITKIAKASKVVNFSVKTNENYFANGVLTHNCYMKRHKPEGLDVAKNTNDILTEINSHSMFAVVEKPNQTHEKYVTYDISCNEDFALHLKYHEWRRIFQFFKDSPVAFGSFATKYVNPELLTFDSSKKIRIRFSLMPQKYADLLEPNTSKIVDRIKAIGDFVEAGYDVHINFSPVIVTEGWLAEYEDLFNMVNSIVPDAIKGEVKAEVIFLTHNEGKHIFNLKNKLPGEELLWNPVMQETKVSKFGGVNLRYKSQLKSDFIQQFLKVHSKIIPWNTVRYIF